MRAAFSCALITGASSGLGAEFARQLAHSCEIIVLSARREDRLQDLASELLQAVPKLFVYTKTADISSSEGREGLLAFLKERELSVDLLVNNAGLGDYGEFDSSEWGKTESMLHVNVEAMTHMTYSLLPDLKKNRGGIINLSSLAASLPIPDFAVYAASKAYVSSFSEALRLEVKGQGVDVLAVCPGPVATEFGSVAKRTGYVGDLVPGRDLFYTTKQTVVRQSLKALGKGRARLFPGWKVKLSGVVIGCMPLFVLRFVMAFRPRRVL